MGGGHHHGPGFHPPHVRPVHRWLAVGMGATMWFWLMYRTKKDGAVMFGLKPPPWVEDTHGEKH
jgi:hypothetical protein